MTRQGRASVLRAFLARPRIYHHQITFEESQCQSRANLATELKELGEAG